MNNLVNSYQANCLFNRNIVVTNMYPAPNQLEVIDWILNKHGIRISIDEYNKYYWCEICDIYSKQNTNYIKKIHLTIYNVFKKKKLRKSHYDAYSDAINFLLDNNII